MRDLRELVTLPEFWLAEGKLWRETPFTWTRWERPHADWTHDHCRFCFACICDHRERYPQEWKEARLERGCYRHAYYAEREEGIYLWVCRTCFKRVQNDFGWSTKPGPARNSDVPMRG